MSKSLLIIASNNDYESLMEYMRSCDLSLVPLDLRYPVAQPKDGPVCYLSCKTIDELHPYGEGNTKLADVIDPLLLFTRPYYDPPYLTDGSIVLNDDVQEVSDQIKPLFNKVARWVRKNWSKHPDHASWVGPEAYNLLQSGKGQWRSCLHAATGKIIRV